MTEHPHEEWRYDTVLGPGDLLVDCGAHKGKFLREMKRRYGCIVAGYEPIKEFYDEWAHSGFADITVRAALGGYERCEMFGCSGDASGAFATEDKRLVDVRAIQEVMAGLNRNVDFMEMNIEGGEYELLDALFATGLITKIRTLQVQFHKIRGMQEECDRRFDAIYKQLLVTHNEQWGEKWWFHRFERK